jgi:hypothetical protein
MRPRTFDGGAVRGTARIDDGVLASGKQQCRGSNSDGGNLAHENGSGREGRVHDPDMIHCATPRNVAPVFTIGGEHGRNIRSEKTVVNSPDCFLVD